MTPKSPNDFVTLSFVSREAYWIKGDIYEILGKPITKENEFLTCKEHTLIGSANMGQSNRYPTLLELASMEQSWYEYLNHYFPGTLLTMNINELI